MLNTPFKQSNDINGSGSIIAQVTGSVLARAYLPAPKHIKQAMSYLDLGIKLEILLYEISSCLYWLSLSELVLFIFGLLLFFADTGEMGGQWLHLLHIVRALVGLLLVKKLPTSHEITKQLNLKTFGNDSKLTFEEIKDFLFKALQESVINFSNTCGTLLTTYMAITCFCFILDFISFVIALS